MPDHEDEPPITVCGQVIEFPYYASPHDPKYANEGRTTRDGQPCNRDCPGEWPCAERKRQRETQRWIADLLRSALYKRTGGRQYAEWTNPLGGTVCYGYGENGMWVVVTHGGKVCAESLDATPEWLAPHA
jgi:hypothetical protein